MSRQKQNEKAVADWNRQHQPGIQVRVTLDDGRTIETKTRSKAVNLGGHSAVIMLDGISGCYLLSRCQPVEMAS